MNDRSHLNAIELRLHNEQMRLKAATSEAEIALRSVWVRQTEDELSAEYKFLGLSQPAEAATMTLDEIMDDEDLLAMLA